MNKKEIILIAILLIIAVSALLIMNLSAQKNDLLVVITIDGEEYRTIPLNGSDSTFTIETPYGYNDVVIKDNGVDIVDADCPTRVCVNTKIADKEGDIIVCLPHKLVIEILPDDR